MEIRENPEERGMVIDLWVSVVTRQLIAFATINGPIPPEAEQGAMLAAINILTELTHAGFGLVYDKDGGK